MGLFTNGAGALLLNNTGQVATSCCCATTTVNPCAPDPYNPLLPSPSIVVSVTGGSGTIDWCGKTWNLPSDNGVQQRVCPDFYILDINWNTSRGIYRETWVNLVTNYNKLSLIRRVTVFSPSE